MDEFNLLEKLDEDAFQIFLDSMDFSVYLMPELINDDLEIFLNSLSSNKVTSQPSDKSIIKMSEKEQVHLRTEVKDTSLSNRCNIKMREITKNINSSLISDDNTMPYDFVLDHLENQQKHVSNLSINGWIRYLKNEYPNQCIEEKQPSVMQTALKIVTSGRIFPQQVTYPTSPLPDISFRNPKTLMKSFAEIQRADCQEILSKTSGEGDTPQQVTYSSSQLPKRPIIYLKNPKTLLTSFPKNQPEQNEKHKLQTPPSLNSEKLTGREPIVRHCRQLKMQWLNYQPHYVAVELPSSLNRQLQLPAFQMPVDKDNTQTSSTCHFVSRHPTTIIKPRPIEFDLEKELALQASIKRFLAS